MAVHVLRRVDSLGPGLNLAPERFDPRRQLAGDAGLRLDTLVQVLTTNRSPRRKSGQDTGQDTRAQRAEPPVLVLDTGHASDGFVIHRHAPMAAAELRSAKRALQPGDVIISRLRPYLRQVAWLDPALFQLTRGGNAVCASTEFFVLRARDPAALAPAALVPFLLSAPVQAALAAGQEGGHHPRFTRAQLAELRVPAAVVNDAAALARGVQQHGRALRRALRGGQSLVARVEGHLSAPQPGEVASSSGVARGGAS